MERSPPQLPVLPHKVAALVPRLGPYLGEYRAGSNVLTLLIFTPLLVLALGGYLVAAYKGFAEAAILAEYPELVFVGALPVPIMAGVFWRAWVVAGRRVFTFAHGILTVRWGRADVYLWEWIACVIQVDSSGFLDRLLSGRYQLRVRRKDGVEFKVNDFFLYAEQLGAWLEEQLRRNRFSSSKAAEVATPTEESPSESQGGLSTAEEHQ